MKRDKLLEWPPYTNAIDAALWRQARVILRCTQVEALEGSDLTTITTNSNSQQRQPDTSDKQPSIGELLLSASTTRSKAVVIDDLPLVHHTGQQPFSETEKKKHQLLLLFIDAALNRHQFASTEMQQAAQTVAKRKAYQKQ